MTWLRNIMNKIYKAGAIIIKNRKLLALHKAGKPYADLIMPGGKVEEGESFIASLRRELVEELSITLSESYVFKTFHAKAMYEPCTLMMTTYFVSYDGAPQASGEIDRLEWIDSTTTSFNLASILGTQLIPCLQTLGKIR